MLVLYINLIYIKLVYHIENISQNHKIAYINYIKFITIVKQ